ncbi:phenylalanine--tRNA ligase subunit beta [Methylococcus sp. EFPC2]|uniref:phenylalanine--tRNA ligase subunit beta n=1 Tax=Methylococcus sp. EFPC2 TaxID=2812648 RepID=UPI00196849E3|nr:phenylalanine--tRNA ligase subunit beta [Methylococcus sp. EFPC2]QSA95668.1 phenylalanine--tRNA ligase subunit beta [Methylococcus sp. EFPC2]
MRFSEAWLRTYVHPPVTTEQLVAQLTMAGLEVDAVEPVAGEFRGVVVGHVLEVEPHPQADRLRVCQVAAGGEAPLTIVCGAPNVTVGMKAPLAVEGAVLPGGMKIGKSKLRGVESFGMLCSARELGLEEGQGGLLALPSDAPVGADLRAYLQLDDVSLEVDLTPNRADCLSVEGVAREVALLNGIDLPAPDQPSSPVSIDATFPVRVEAPEANPRYLGRLIRGVNPQAAAPIWLRERLRRSGLRSLGPVVDATNYILLELGQPLHAFDAAKLQGGIRVRYGVPGETLKLLNDQEVALESDVLVIADEKRPLALAGIMGGADSAVSDATTDIFLECAFFSPTAIMGRARRYGLNTDSSHRYERGVDPELQRRAIERATELLLEIAGGSAGPIVAAESERHLPVRAPIVLRAERVERLLGLSIPQDQTERLLSRLGLKPERQADGWTVTPPGFRFDIAIEADLIEEIGRVYGYDNIPKRSPASHIQLQPTSEAKLDIERVKDLLVDRGYQEAITYSFVDDGLQHRVEPDLESIALKNPISSELAVMRTGLWVGLLDAALKNLNRQQDRVRLFETGLRFTRTGGGIKQEKSLAGLVLGGAHEEQWGEKTRSVDFFDLKADVEAIFRLAGHESAVEFVRGSHPALHPGQNAEIRLAGQALGRLGMLHPRLEAELGFDARVFLFEFAQEPLLTRPVARFASLSKFPQVRRDLAVLVDQAVPVGGLLEAVRALDPRLIRQAFVFDVYQGPGVESGKKSVALGLVIQDKTETLTDARVDTLVSDVLARLSQDFSAKLRD